MKELSIQNYLRKKGFLSPTTSAKPNLDKGVGLLAKIIYCEIISLESTEKAILNLCRLRDEYRKIKDRKL